MLKARILRSLNWHKQQTKNNFTIKSTSLTVNKTTKQYIRFKLVVIWEYVYTDVYISNILDNNTYNLHVWGLDRYLYDTIDALLTQQKTIFYLNKQWKLDLVEPLKIEQCDREIEYVYHGSLARNYDF